MYKTVKTSLVTGGQVVRELLRRFGPGQVCQVVQETEGVFRVHLLGGRTVQATVLANGTLSIQEMEDAA